MMLYVDCGIEHFRKWFASKVGHVEHLNALFNITPHHMITVTYYSTVSHMYCVLCMMCSGGSGVISCYDDIGRFRHSTSCSSVMLARAAQWNPSVFSREGLQPIACIIQQYIRYVSVCCCCCFCSSHCLMQIYSHCSCNAFVLVKVAALCQAQRLVP